MVGIMKKVSAIAILKAGESVENIVVFSANVKEVGEEIRHFYGRGISRSVPDKQCYQLQLTSGSKIFIIAPTFDGSKLRGVRGNCLIVEGKADEVDKDFYNEVLIPLRSVCFEPDKIQKLSELCGSSVWQYARRNELIFTDE